MTTPVQTEDCHLKTDNSKRLYLFDIDGTLLNSGGAGSAAMRLAFHRVFGVEDGFATVDFAGRSDLAIITDALDAIGVRGGELVEAVRRFKRHYYGCLPAMMAERKGSLLPGVKQLLENLSEYPNATLMLGTGNFRRSAGIKLRHFGIDTYFRGGGFGDRTGHRPTLVAQGIRAADRIAGRHGTVFVIGDTVHDVTAAKANSAIAVAVATGIAPRAALEAAGADVVLNTLEEAMALIGPRG
jgi:phosphoglycolate phosphatase-like HAD superfamily hydrolase